LSQLSHRGERYTHHMGMPNTRISHMSNQLNLRGERIQEDVSWKRQSLTQIHHKKIMEKTILTRKKMDIEGRSNLKKTSPSRR
jgi:hypothetical protein